MSSADGRRPGSLSFGTSGYWFAALLVAAGFAFWPRYLGRLDEAIDPYTHFHAIVATAWRNARAWAGVEGIPDVAPVGAAPIELAGAVDRGGDLAKVVGIAGVAAAGAVAAREVVRGRSRPAP